MRRQHFKVAQGLLVHSSQSKEQFDPDVKHFA